MRLKKKVQQARARARARAPKIKVGAYERVSYRLAAPHQVDARLVDLMTVATRAAKHAERAGRLTRAQRNAIEDVIDLLTTALEAS